MVDGTVFTDGFPVPYWNLTAHIAAMDTQGVNYSIISVSAPGMNFLANDSCAAADLARQLNDVMYSYTQLYPSRLEAICVLPHPDVDAALDEVNVSSPNQETQ